jgi:hypothetical protein
MKTETTATVVDSVLQLDECLDLRFAVCFDLLSSCLFLA